MFNSIAMEKMINQAKESCLELKEIKERYLAELKAYRDRNKGLEIFKTLDFLQKAKSQPEEIVEKGRQIGHIAIDFIFHPLGKEIESLEHDVQVLGRVNKYSLH